jgi:hypothetical protein
MTGKGRQEYLLLDCKHGKVDPLFIVSLRINH